MSRSKIKTATIAPAKGFRLAAVTLPLVAGAVLLAAPASSPQAQASQSEVLPGYWEYTTSVLGVRDTEQKCVRPSEIHRFFGGMSTRRWQCTYSVREASGGNARFQGVCTDRKNRRVNVRLNGTYQPESFRFNGGAQITRGTPYIPATITARRLAAQCPANAEYF